MGRVFRLYDDYVSEMAASVHQVVVRRLFRHREPQPATA
jgi:hypothetical protein